MTRREDWNGGAASGSLGGVILPFWTTGSCSKDATACGQQYRVGPAAGGRGGLVALFSSKGKVNFSIHPFHRCHVKLTPLLYHSE